MHTVRVIVAGLALLGLCWLLARGLLGARRPWVVRGSQAFLPLWFLVAAVNLWIGVTRAGYTVAEELPIFLVVFGVPAAVAAAVWWRASGS